jgi:hypothetical protein
MDAFNDNIVIVNCLVGGGEAYCGRRLLEYDTYQAMILSDKRGEGITSICVFLLMVVDTKDSYLCIPMLKEIELSLI